VTAPSPRAGITAPPPTELLVVVGPTASGKSDLAMELAERFAGEIISADSVQIVRRFDIGSGKPTAEERARVAHHLVDACDPLDPMDAARFATAADAAIDDIRARGKVPIVCGGTFLWVKALVSGLAPGAPADAAIRKVHAERAEKEGRAALHAALVAIDPAAAARLAPNDLVRVSRALEVFEITGQTLTDWHAGHRFATERHAARLVGVDWPRDVLDTRIAARVRGWLAGGWIEEVEGLLAEGLGEARAMGSVGYKQVRDALEGRLRRDELEGAIVRATRVFVRRQRTWLRDEPVTWVV
jgi:tRNA dimethylallyltransferase